MAKKTKNLSLSEVKDSYIVNVSIEYQDGMSGGQIAGIIIGFLFFLLVGVILLIVFLLKNKKGNDIHNQFKLSKNNWHQELERQLIANNYGGETDWVRNQVTQKIQILESM